MRPITPSALSFGTFSLQATLALGIGFAVFGSSALAQAPATQATPPGPATQPPPPPGTAQPGPTQPPAAPAPPGTTTAPGAPAPAAPAAAPVNYNVQYNGLIDGYYLFNLRNPKNVSAGAGETYYDDRHNSPTLSLAELNVFKTARPSAFGFKATFMTGDTADLNHFDFEGASHGLGEARYKNVQQLYGTYALGGDGAGIDFGKFYTPFGYEVTESNGNYNYSRSTAYNYVPFYHAGARIYTPLPGLAALTATFYLVNGVFNTPTMGVQNDSKRPGYIGQLNYTDPKGKFTLISELGLDKQKNPLFAGTGTPENLSGNTSSKVILNDNNFTYNINANQLFGIDYVYRKLTPDGGPKDTTSAYAFYYRQALTAKNAFALRFSGAQEKTDGYTVFTPVTILGPGTLKKSLVGFTPNDISSVTARPYDLTATYEIKATANFLTRFEYRHDHSNVPTFFGASYNGADNTDLKKDQDTLSLSGVFTF